MELSTSLNIAFPTKNNEPDLDYTIPQQLDDMKDVGFTCFDFNFVDYTRVKDSPLLSDRWENWISDIRKRAEENGQRFYQSHGHMFDIIRFYDEDANTILFDRAIRGSAMLGVKWVVYHPYYCYDRTECRKKTYERFAFLRDFGEKQGIGIAIENMPYPEKYGGETEEIMEIAEKLDLGVCWDTSHANLCGYKDQAKQFAVVGDRLKALHVSDNFGHGDDHLAPLYGTIDWNNVLDGLKAVGYTGTFNFEAHQFVRKLPFAMHLDACRLLYRIGDELIHS